MQQTEISGLLRHPASGLPTARAGKKSRPARAVFAAGMAAIVLLAGCASPFKSQTDTRPSSSAVPGSGRYYLDDGPGERPIAELETLPDAVPRAEPLHRFANRPYVVFGRSYQPMTRLESFTERGTATWYGRRYHDRPTATGERYDMYAMTAAHTRLPLPSYAKVTNLRNGRSVVVRVNDRGPFLHGRVIDVSYAAAARLGFASAGSAEVEVELITDPEALTAGAARPSIPMSEPIRPVAPTIETARPSDPPPSASRMPVAAPQVLTAPAQPVITAPPATPPKVLASTTPPAALARTASAASPPRPSGEAARSQPEATPVLMPGTQLVQVGSYSNRDTADAARRALEGRLGSTGYPLWVRQEGRLFRVVMGPFKSPEQSVEVVNRIRTVTGIEAVTRPL